MEKRSRDTNQTACTVRGEQDGARRRKFSWRGPSRYSVAKNARLGLQAPPSFFARAAQCRCAQSSSVHGVKQVHASYDALRFPILALSTRRAMNERLAINLIRCDHWRCPSRAVPEPHRYFTLLAPRATSQRVRRPRRGHAAHAGRVPGEKTLSSDAAFPSASPASTVRINTSVLRCGESLDEKRRAPSVRRPRRKGGVPVFPVRAPPGLLPADWTFWWFLESWEPDARRRPGA